MTTHRRRLGVSALAACIAAASCVAEADAAEGPTATPESHASLTSTLILRGRALYQGLQPFAKPALIEGVALPDARCGACHGSSAEARSEAGVSIPSIQWRALMLPTQAAPAYRDGDAVMHALATGSGRSTEPLRAPMPRYSLSLDEQKALAAYLQAIGTDQDPVPGVTVNSITVGTVLPLTGAQSAQGLAIREALLLQFEAANRAGGVFGRRLVLRVADGGDNAATASRAALTLLDDTSGQGVFALVGSVLANPDKALLDALLARPVPLIATLGMPLLDATDASLSYILPSVSTQLRHLAKALDDRCKNTDLRTALLVSTDAMAGFAHKVSLPGFQTFSVNDQAGLEALWRTDPPGRVIALLDGSLLSHTRKLMLASQRPSCLGTLAAISGKPSGQAGLLLSEATALPMALSSQTRALWPVLAQAAARTLVEALSRTGRQVNVARLTSALESLHQFEAAPGLRLHFSAQRRHGLDATHVWTETPHASNQR